MKLKQTHTMLFGTTARFFVVILSLLCNVNLHGQTISYLPYLFTSANFVSSNGVDVSFAVGAIKGNASVDQMGNATYAIPISCPDGTQGVQPHISLVYNSSAGNGELGKGWQIGGLSAITRKAKTLYYDNLVTPIYYNDFDEDDVTLDGVQLILTGVSGTTYTYTTESQNFSSITAYDVGPSGPLYFLVVTKDGTTMEYGYNSFSQLSGGVYPFSWLLDRVTDACGNYMTFSYTPEGTGTTVTPICNQELCISEIDYTANDGAGLSAYNKITFTYASGRIDANTMYDGDNIFQTSQLLTGITTTGISPTGTGSATYRTYALTYGNDGIASYLMNISEQNGGYMIFSNYLNSTAFEYGDTTAGIIAPGPFTLGGTAPVCNNKNGILYTCDFNGDGIADLVQESFSTGSGGQEYISRLDVYTRNYGSDTYNDYIHILWDDPFLSTTTPGTYYPGSSTLMIQPLNDLKFQTQDFNGDGIDDILLPNAVYEGPIGSPYIYARSFNLCLGGSGYSTPPTPLSISITGDHQYCDPAMSPLVISGDFDGDGKCDFLTFLSDGTLSNYQAILFRNMTTSTGTSVTADQENISGFNFTGGTENDIPNALIAGTAQIFVMDYNGDGKDDVMVVTPNQCTIFDIGKDSYSGEYKAGPLFEVSYSGSGLFTSGNKFYVGDFNGDGKADLLIEDFSSGSPVWNIAYSQGLGGIGFASDGFDIIPITTSGGYGLFAMGLPSSGDVITIGDFNGDGKSDIAVELNEGLPTSIEYDVYYSRGYSAPGVMPSFSKTRWTGTPASGNTSAYFLAADIDGDGRTDLVNVPTSDGGSSGAWTSTGNIYALSFRNRGQENLLQSVIDGMGNQTSFSYSPLTSGSPFYVAGAPGSVSFPLENFQDPIYLVNEMSTFVGTPYIEAQAYQYTAEVIHKQGKGLLGPQTVVSNDILTSIQTVQSYSINPTYYAPYLSQSKTLLLAGGDISTVDYNYSFAPVISYTTPYVAYVQTLANTSTTNGISGGLTTTSYTYDSWSNPLTITTDINGQETITTTNTYESVSSSPVIDGVAVNTKLNTFSTMYAWMSSPSLTVAGGYSYDGNGNVLEEDDNTESGAISSAKAYTYFGTGSVKTMIKNEPVGVHESWSYAYDPTYRYQTSITNPLSQSKTATYNPLSGKPLTTTGIDGNLTTYSYDAWDNLAGVETPEGYGIAYSIGWNTALSPTNLYYTYVSNPGKPFETIWYDCLGRQVSKQDVFTAGTTTSNTTYNTAGLTASYTKPYLTSETPFTTNYLYDGYNRLLTSVNPYGTIGYAYTSAGGNTTVATTDAGGHVTTQVTDATGKVIEAADASATLVYNYDSRGNLLTVGELHGSPFVTNTYDPNGNKASTFGIGGLTTYGHDAFGRLVSQTDARSNTHTFAYNLLNQVTSSTGPEGTTTYAYGTSGGGINQPLSVASPGVTEAYTYDTYGEVTSDIKTIAGTPFETDYLHYYDYGLGLQLIGIKYPSGLCVNNQYNNFGDLTMVTGCTSGIGLDYVVGAEIIFSGITMNGSHEWTEYKLENGLTTHNVYSYGLPTHYSTSGVQDMVFGWDVANGNLTTRTDQLAQIQDQYLYDGLNRLTQAQTWQLMAGPGLASQTNVSYFPAGQIRSKTDVGTENSGGSSGWASTYAQDLTGDISTYRQNITYTSFNKVATIRENGYEEDFTYDASHNLVMSVLTNGTGYSSTRYYIGRCEANMSSYTGTGYGVSSPLQYVNYINGGDGLAAIVTNTDQFYSIYKDNQGSLLTATNSTGGIVATQAFDAWGRYRSQATGLYLTYPYAAPATPYWFYRGYTGHEHLPQFDLINMNARLYDPTLSSMLSPDNDVQSPFSLQGYNRYSYCRNNPTSATDPSGNDPLFAIAAIAGGLYNLFANDNKLHGSFWQEVGEGAEYFVAGALGGIATVAGGPYAGFAAGGSLNVAIDGINNNLTYGKFGLGFFQKPFQSFITGGTSALVGGGAAYQVGTGPSSSIGGGVLNPYPDGTYCGGTPNSNFTDFFKAVTNDEGSSLLYSGYKNVAWDFGRNNFNFTDKSNVAVGTTIGDLSGGAFGNIVSNLLFPTDNGNPIFGKAIFNSLVGNSISQYISSFIQNPMNAGNFNTISPVYSNNGSYYNIFNNTYNIDNSTQSAGDITQAIFQLFH